MTNQTPSLSDKQLKTLQILQKIKMGWIMFWFLLVVFAIAFALLIISVFFARAAAWVQIGFFLFNGIIGSSIRALIAYLFPAGRSAPKAKKATAQK